jgi:hypothetical protein
LAVRKLIMRISMSELIASGIRLRPVDAVAIVGELCRQRAARVIPALPSLEAIWLGGTGDITIQGPTTPGAEDVPRAAQLLQALLADADAAPEYQASSALRLVIARGLGMIDLPAYPSLESFCAALVCFTTVDARDSVAALVAAFDAKAAQAQTGSERADGSQPAHVSRRRAVAAWIARRFGISRLRARASVRRGRRA